MTHRTISKKQKMLLEEMGFDTKKISRRMKFENDKKKNQKRRKKKYAYAR